MTVRDLARRDDPISTATCTSRSPTRRANDRAEHEGRVNRALPADDAGLDDAQQRVDRAVANMPDPTYPRR